MPELGPDDALPHRPERILIAGTSGSGKTTLGGRLGERLGLSHTEIDALYQGPGWTVRPGFLDDVRGHAAASRWITEYQYAAARPLLLARCDLAVVLLLPRRVVLTRVVRRTVLLRSAPEVPRWLDGPVRAAHR